MNFFETVEKARAFLERNGRVSLHGLQSEFGLDDDALDELIDELVAIQRVAVREGRALAWVGVVAPAPPQASEHERSPLDYTPRHLADRILRSKSALEGERKHVTVLFADVKSSMDLSEGLDPEVWHGIMDRFFAILNEGVHRFEGTVNQYTGDGIMALFGAPIAHEDHAQRACYAALHLRDELRRYGDELRLKRGLNISVRMGLNSGEVVIGKIGDDLRMDYTAQGHAVGIAQRMEGLAEAGRVYLTGATQELVAGYFELRDLGPTAVKGVREPVRVYELEGIGELSSRFDLSRARGLSKFVGRKDEMTTLLAALERTSAGEGQVVGVVGQAGTGKSRLCHEFLERCRATGVVVRRAQCLSHGKTTPLLPVIELMRQTFEIDERDSPQTARNKIAGTVVLIGGEMEPDLPLVFDLLGVPDSDRPAPALPPDDRQRRITGLLRRFIQARSERDTGVVLIEDLHWMDGASEKFIAEVAPTIARSRTLLLLNFRPEYHADWMQGTNYQQIPLRALGPEDSEELLDHLLGGDPSLREFRRRIGERSRGNPFFIEELVRSLVEAGSLAGMRGAYYLASDSADLELPSSVQAVLSARIDRLPEEQKRILQAASVIGDRFNEQLLGDVAESAVEGAVRELAAAEFLYEEAIYPEREYAFVHPLTREVAYRTQLAERRARLHSAAARALSTSRPEAPGSHAAILAHHYDEAGEALPAARWHARAAHWSGIGHPAQTFIHLQRLRELTEALDPSPEVDELGAMARVQLILVGARIGVPPDEIRPLYEEGVEWARRSGRRDAMAWVLTAYGYYRDQAEGAVEAAIAELEEAVRLGTDCGDVNLELTSRYNLSVALVHRDPSRAAEILDEIIERANRNTDAELLLFTSAPAVLLWLKVTLLSWLGRLSEAEATQRELERLGAKQESAVVRNQVLGAGATLALYQGDAEKSLRLTVEALECLGEDSLPTSRVLAYSGMSQAHAEAGDHRAALESAEKALAILRGEHVIINWEPAGLSLVAMQRARCGDPEGAIALADEAVSLSLERGSLLGEIFACEARGICLLLARGASARTEVAADLDRAARAAERTHLRGFAARLLERRAELAGVLGDTEGRRRWLGEAERAFRDLGAERHAQRVAREQGS